MTLLTVMLVAAFFLISAEFRTTNGSFSMNRSLSFAQAGLQSYFAAGRSIGSKTADTVTYSYTGGYARVIAKQLRAKSSSERALWIVYSWGVDSTRSIVVNGTGQRYVAQMARLNTGSMPSIAAVETVNALYIQDGTNVDGSDGCNWGTGNVAGVVSYTADLLPIGAHANQLGGSPPSVTVASRSAAYDSTHIDWLSLLAGEFTADYDSIVPGSSYVSYYSQRDTTIVLANKSYTGLLVASGNVLLQNRSTWNGVIIAGGWIRSQSSRYNVNGAFVSGLNNLKVSGCTTSRTSPCVGDDSLTGGTGATNIQWNSCRQANAVATTATLVPIKGTFTDSWKTY